MQSLKVGEEGKSILWIPSMASFLNNHDDGDDPAADDAPADDDDDDDDNDDDHDVWMIYISQRVDTW